MSVATLPSQHTNVLALPTLRQFSVDQYLQLIDSGVLGKYDQVELIEGWLVNKMSRNAAHDSTITRLDRCLHRLLPDDWVVRIQSAVILSRSVPEPDFAIFPGPIEAYDTRKPLASEAALLIEVAESSLLYDRDEKGSLYAQAAVPLYWIVNLVDRIVEVYTQPRGGKKPTYRRRKDHDADEVLPLILKKLMIGQIPVANILPRQS